MPGNRRHIPKEQKWLIITMSAHLSNHDIAVATEISERTIRRVLKRWRETGDVICRPLQAGRPRELTSLEVSYLEGLITRSPDLYLTELKECLEETYGVGVDERTISNSLERRGYTRKSITRSARERDEERRNTFQAEVGERYPPHTLVFLDEAACNRHTSKRSKAWAPKGDRARQHDFFVRGTRYSVLPTISLSGILHIDVLTRSWSGEEFKIYVEVLLDNMNPYPQSNSVLVMDNASLHHFEGLREIVEERGMRLLYLPPYSPDFNPIEEGFSAMKAWIRRNKDFVLGELSGNPTCDPYAMLWEAVFATMTPENIAGWYRDSGYVT